MSGSAVSQSGTDWRRAVEPYVGSDARRSSFQVITTLGLLALSMWSAHMAIQWSAWWSLVFALPTAGLLVRTFVLMHDCAHGSFYSSKKLNDTIGFIGGMLTLTPFSQWRRDHALHHASSGDLDRRGHGDMPTLTVREYLAKSPKGRFGYRIVRHPVLLLIGGPIHLMISQRMRAKSTATGALQQSSVLSTNIAIAGMLAIGLLIAGWKTVLLAYLFPFYLAAMTGVWLFYVQHQFEEAYWEPHEKWDYLQAALHGSSHLKLPRILGWFTGDIGLHHVHHVQPRIPNYRLQRCHEENPLFHNSPVLTLRSGMQALRLSLWDEEQGKLVSFKDVHNS